MAQNPDSLFDLLDLERFFQNGDWAFGEDPVEHRAVGITGNDDDRAVGLLFLGHVVNVIGRPVRQFKIEKNEVELLFLNCGKRFLDCADDDATEADLPQKHFEQVLQILVVIDNEHARLTGFLLFQNVLIEGDLFEAPGSADLDGGQLSALHEIINSRQGNAKVLGGFLDGQEIMHGRKTSIHKEMGKTFSTNIAL